MGDVHFVLSQNPILHPLELVVLPLTLVAITILISLKPSWSSTCATRDCCEQNRKAQEANCRTVDIAVPDSS